MYKIHEHSKWLEYVPNVVKSEKSSEWWQMICDNQILSESLHCFDSQGDVCPELQQDKSVWWRHWWWWCKIYDLYCSEPPGGDQDILSGPSFYTTVFLLNISMLALSHFMLWCCPASQSCTLLVQRVLFCHQFRWDLNMQHHPVFIWKRILTRLLMSSLWTNSNFVRNKNPIYNITVCWALKNLRCDEASGFVTLLWLICWWNNEADGSGNTDGEVGGHTEQQHC